ncbi:response regulator [Cohnella silvisoli]|uniref:Response regulator n=1 Tax=Cohnella silvisoli TaxID=2873699 RepID=A0ABV1KZH2_9BACL|nr:response regulator [Cohnella silvisoli]MCD9024798.1 response regulator [Cohnella silvisoli]
MYTALIVDDERMIREDLRAFVDWDINGFSHIREAKNGIEAMALMESDIPDLILIDINMPRMSGLELIERMRASGIQSQIVIISAYSEFQYAQRAISYGVSEYVLKPIVYREINQIIQRASKRLQQQSLEQTRNRIRETTKQATESLLPLLWQGNRSAAHQSANRLFDDLLAFQRYMEPPAESLVLFLQNLVFEIEIHLNDSSSSLYAARQTEFLDLIKRFKAAPSTNDLNKLMHHTIDLAIDLQEKLQVSQGNKEFSKLQSIVRAHLTEELSLEWLANRVHMNANYLSVLFRKETGENFNDFLIRERMMLARTLIVREENKINEVSAMVGYQNYRSFSRAFKRYFGFTPSDLR